MRTSAKKPIAIALSAEEEEEYTWTRLKSGQSRAG